MLHIYTNLPDCCNILFHSREFQIIPMLSIAENDSCLIPNVAATSLIIYATISESVISIIFLVLLSKTTLYKIVLES